MGRVERSEATTSLPQTITVGALGRASSRRAPTAPGSRSRTARGVSARRHALTLAAPVLAQRGLPLLAGAGVARTEDRRDPPVTEARPAAGRHLPQATG